MKAVGQRLCVDQILGMKPDDVVHMAVTNSWIASSIHFFSSKTNKNFSFKGRIFFDATVVERFHTTS
jgi:hypothetical protein